MLPLNYNSTAEIEFEVLLAKLVKVPVVITARFIVRQPSDIWNVLHQASGIL